MTEDEIITLERLLAQFHQEMNSHPHFSHQSYYNTRVDVLDQLLALLPE